MSFSLQGVEYYISDNSGLPLTKDGMITLHKRGSTTRYEWTLGNWLNFSGIRYQSRARLFCVQKTNGIVYILVCTLSLAPFQHLLIPFFMLKITSTFHSSLQTCPLLNPFTFHFKTCPLLNPFTLKHVHF